MKKGVNPLVNINAFQLVTLLEEPSLYAFSYVALAWPVERGGFIVVCGGKVHGLTREKVRFVMAVLEARFAALGIAWDDALVAQTYAVRGLGPFLDAEIVR